MGLTPPAERGDERGHQHGQTPRPAQQLVLFVGKHCHEIGQEEEAKANLRFIAVPPRRDEMHHRTDRKTVKSSDQNAQRTGCERFPIFARSCQG